MRDHPDDDFDPHDGVRRRRSAKSRRTPTRHSGKAVVRRHDEKRSGEPLLLVVTHDDFGLVALARRRQLKLKQTDVARQVGVGRQWIGALEARKPGLELTLVLRTLDALGIDIMIRPREPVPAWTLPLTAEACVRLRRRDANLQRRARAGDILPTA
jgi:DNA-binding XRE family transcriptional regulator